MPIRRLQMLVPCVKMCCCSCAVQGPGRVAAVVQVLLHVPLLYVHLQYKPDIHSLILSMSFILVSLAVDSWAPRQENSHQMGNLPARLPISMFQLHWYLNELIDLNWDVLSVWPVRPQERALFIPHTHRHWSTVRFLCSSVHAHWWSVWNRITVRAVTSLVSVCQSE